MNSKATLRISTNDNFRITTDEENGLVVASSTPELCLPPYPELPGRIYSKQISLPFTLNSGQTF